MKKQTGKKSLKKLSNQASEQNPFKTKQFTSLQAKWYKALKKEGFEDIEEFKQGTDYLKSWHCNYFQARYSPTTFESNREYFEMACRFLYDYNFSSPQEKQIWDLHAQGETIRGIAKIMKKSTTTVNQLIIRLRKIMIKDGTSPELPN